MSDPTFLRLDSVGKRYGQGQPVLDQVTLAVSRGDFITFIGPSGCGKSTLLRMIAGLTQPSHGTVTIDGQDPAAARKDLFFVFQDASLLPWRTAAGNVELPLQLRGEPPDSRKRRAAEMLERVGLSDAGAKYPWQLSGGMRMRVSLARALSLSPRLLLMDEPFGSLDEMTRDRLNEDLLALRAANGFTGLFVTHSVAEAVFLSTRIVVLSSNPGRISEIIAVPFPYPRPSELREEPAFLTALAQTSRALRAVQPARR